MHLQLSLLSSARCGEPRWSMIPNYTVKDMGTSKKRHGLCVGREGSPSMLGGDAHSPLGVVERLSPLLLIRHQVPSQG